MTAEFAKIDDGKRKKPPAQSPVEPFSWSPSKITPPTLSSVADNARLFSRLDTASARPIVWLQGPPGAGKTTLIASWLTARGHEPVWHRVDAEDSDPATLFFYLGMADARGRETGRGRRLPLLTPDYQFGIAAFSRNFFKKLFDRQRSPIVVFDDYHEIGPTSPVHECLAAGMAEVPAGAHVVVVSRLPPPKEFARLRVNGQIELLTPELLRLRADEAEAIARARDMPFDAAHLEKILDLTQGWTSGLILMLEAARSGTSIAFGEAKAVPELLFDYFAGEVLQSLEEREQRLLMSLSIMPSMTAAAAERLTGDAEAGELLERLAKRSYFTVRDAETQPNYRFHPLFRQFLQASARRSIDPAEHARLRLRAAEALETSGQPDAAAPLLQEAAAWDDLARLIRDWAGQLEATGRHKTLTAWLDMLPREKVESDGWLSYWTGAALLPYAPSVSRPILRRALAMLAEAADATGVFLAWERLTISIRYDALADQGELDPAIVLLRQFIRRFQSFPSAEIEGRVAISMYAALSRRSNDRKEIAHWRQRALDAAANASSPAIAAMARMTAAIYGLFDGDFSGAREQFAALPAPQTLNDAPVERSMIHFATALAQFYRQAPGDHLETVAEAMRNDDLSGVHPYSHVTAACAAIDCATAGDLDQARYWQRRTGECSDRFGVRPLEFYDRATAIVEHCSGHLAEAVRAAHNAVEKTAAQGFYYNEGHARLTLAQVSLDAGDLATADEQLREVEAIVERSASELLRFPQMLSRAEFLDKSGRREQAFAALSEAMRLGERSGARRCFISRNMLARLCARALAKDIEPAFVRMIIRLEHLSPPQDERIEQWPWPLKIATLGPFALFKDDEPLAHSRKTPRRLFNLLKAIVAFGGKNVAQEKIIDAVWPDEDGDSARQSFDVAIHRLRKLIGDNQAILVKGGVVGFDPARCWLDVWAFEDGLDAKGATQADIARTLALYGGDFLAGAEDLYWAEPRRKAMRAKFVKASEALARQYAEAGDGDRALAVFRGGIAACPDAETLYQGMIRVQTSLGQKEEAIATYQRLCAALSFACLTPSPATEALYRALDA